jgi:hypothetical protein
MNFFKKLFNNRISFKCNYCGAEIKATLKLVERLENKNRGDAVCPPKIECHYCHMGFVIPLNYKSKNGKIYKFDELADKIPTLDPDSLFDRLLDEDNF